MKLRSLGIFIAVLVAAGCEGEQASIACRPFASSLTINDRLGVPAAIFNADESVYFKLEVTNNGTTASYLYGYSNCSNVYFRVTDSTGQLVWPINRLACSASIDPAPTAPNINPSESVIFGAVFPGGEPMITPDHRVIADRIILNTPGIYRVQANAELVTHDSTGMVYSCRESLSKSTTFEIR